MRTPQRHSPGVRRARKDRWMRVVDPDRLRRARLYKGWSQRQLAALCHRSQTAIYLVESGSTDTIREDFAMTWAREVDVPPGEVFGDLPGAVVLEVASGSGIAGEQVPT